MGGPQEVGPGIFAVAGPDLTDGRDALAYLIADGGDLALIDAGAGPSYPLVLDNIRKAGGDPARLVWLIATHAHIDHIGSFGAFVRDFSPATVAHKLDAEALETADRRRTAADWYGLPLEPVKVNRPVRGREEALVLGETNLICLHTPGHTPGSMAVYLDRAGRRYLFGQDIHGPFDPAFGSDRNAWRASMQLLLDLEADVLGEGHYGVFDGAEKVASFINRFLKSK